MLNLEKRIKAFVSLGEELIKISDGNAESNSGGKNLSKQADELYQLMNNSLQYNGWFTPGNVTYMIHSIGNSLQIESVDQWLAPYFASLREDISPKTIGVVMAGNIPAVGFHDLLCVLISGNRLLGKLSSDDNKLLPAIMNLLVEIEPGFKDCYEFTENRLSDFDAVIATGSNNTSRYFEYYFGKYKHIIRKNRNGVAVLTGNESEDDLEKLGLDIFTYYGLGCRNVSKLMVPRGFDFNNFLEKISEYVMINENHKYFNNYEYNKAIYLVNGTPHFDSGNLLLVENEMVASPVSVVNYGYYDSESELKSYLNDNSENIQCVVSKNNDIVDGVPFGTSQQPALWDYADGVDTLSFLLALK